MTQFIEKHRRLLQAYCLIARIVGWLLLLGGLVWFFALVKNTWQITEDQKQIDFLLYVISSLVYDFFIPGFLAFAIGGLLDYLLRPMARPPLILRMTDKLCYFYAFFLFLKFLIATGPFDKNPLIVIRFLWISEMPKASQIIFIQPLLGPTLAKVLLLVGVGMILHRLLPVIEESKTLV
ncbi:MAG: hypothetical protein JW749_11870 [Sedimentisphaerales bacterium]|nr:hypothetical protein [Sedimentisphaerales bacterium]